MDGFVKAHLGIEVRFIPLYVGRFTNYHKKGILYGIDHLKSGDMDIIVQLKSLKYGRDKLIRCSPEEVVFHIS